MDLTIGLNEIIELVRFELRRYGFRADGEGKIHYGAVHFDTEPATGMASFTQESVTPCFSIISSKNYLHRNETFDFNENTRKLYLRIGVDYKHVQSGSNGYMVEYVIEKFFDGNVKLRKIN